MKITVYAICKNEAAFVRRWMDSMSEADAVAVLDTGSDDGSPQLLRRAGAAVTEEVISPWRFDAARNRSLELVPEDTDICVCTDLDEVLRPGWRRALERCWKPGTCRASYRCIWSFRPDGGEGTVFRAEKAHARFGFQWIHPVHEILARTDGRTPGRAVYVPEMVLEHHPDLSKSRSQYLPLLELAVQENPEDDRNMHYLGREYMYLGRWDDCIRTLQRHLALPTARWKEERAASMRYLARACAAKGQLQTARDWCLCAVAQAPHLREPWVELAALLYRQEDWDGVLFAAGRALTIRERPACYISEAGSWGSLPHDLRAIAFHRTGRIPQALAEAELALALEPEDPRLQSNVSLLKELL